MWFQVTPMAVGNYCHAPTRCGTWIQNLGNWWSLPTKVSYNRINFASARNSWENKIYEEKNIHLFLIVNPLLNTIKQTLELYLWVGKQQSPFHRQADDIFFVILSMILERNICWKQRDNVSMKHHFYSSPPSWHGLCQHYLTSEWRCSRPISTP